MIENKVLEVRDRMTCIPVLALKMRSADPIDDRFLWRCGYPRGDDPGAAVVLMRLYDQRAASDPYEWDNQRTMVTAHLWIDEHYDELVSGQVVDVRVILGEEKEPAPAEIWRG